MASNFDPNGGKCDSCGLYRSLRDGMCHECEQAERDAADEFLSLSNSDADYRDRD